jgi:hypothetical protein
MMLDEAKVNLVEFCINSIDNGFADENVQLEIQSCITLAKTIKQPFDKRLLLQQLDDMVRERVSND